MSSVSHLGHLQKESREKMKDCMAPERRVKQSGLHKWILTSTRSRIWASDEKNILYQGVVFMAKHLAIQLFGHLRTFEHTIDKFKQFVLDPNIQESYQVDLFIHTWDQIDHQTINWRNPDGHVLDDSSFAEQRICELYHPKKLVVEKQLEIEEQILIEKIGGVKRSIKGCLNNAYTVYKVNELRKAYEAETGVRYDWVLQTRPDIIFKTPLSIKDYEAAYSDNHLPLPEDAIFYGCNLFNRAKVQDDRLICGSDIIYFAKPDCMNKAVSLYTDFNGNIDINNFYCFDYWWLSYWKKQGLQTIPVKYLHGQDWFVLYKDMLVLRS